MLFLISNTIIWNLTSTGTPPLSCQGWVRGSWTRCKSQKAFEILFLLFKIFRSPFFARKLTTNIKITKSLKTPLEDISNIPWQNKYNWICAPYLYKGKSSYETEKLGPVQSLLIISFLNTWDEPIKVKDTHSFRRLYCFFFKPHRKMLTYEMVPQWHKFTGNFCWIDMQ